MQPAILPLQALQKVATHAWSCSGLRCMAGMWERPRLFCDLTGVPNHEHSSQYSADLNTVCHKYLSNLAPLTFTD